MSAECGTRFLYVGPEITVVGEIQNFLSTSVDLSDLRDVEGEWD